MKKIVFVLIVCFLLALPAVCLGATGWYGGVNAGLAAMPDGVNYFHPFPHSNLPEQFVFALTTIPLPTYDHGFTVGGAVGYMMEKFRFEGELSYQTNDMDSLPGPGGSLSLNCDVSVLTLLTNGYFDFSTGGPLTPYITVGLGYSNVEIVIEGESYDDNLFTYQLGIGVGYAMTEQITLDLRYRYLGFEDYEYSESGVGSLSAEVSSHNITAGLRFAFKKI
jgi:opacity protein-like surface antigen